MLNDQQKKFFSNKYNLSYHLSFLEHCNNLISLRGLNVLEIGGSLPPELVLDIYGCNSWTAIESSAYDNELGDANQFHVYDPPKLSSYCNGSSDSYQIHCLSIEDLGEEFYEKYDLVFSIACFEHLTRLPLALKQMHKCLKSNGHLFTIHSPIWSAYDGHHLPIKIPSKFLTKSSNHLYVFKPWGHLLQGIAETYIDICERFDKDFAEKVVYYTYNSPHINRYFSEDYIAMIRSSDFEIVNLELCFERRPPQDVQTKLEILYPGYKYFSNNGIHALLRKPS